MTCEKALDVQAYVDGELDAAASLAVERHLLTCDACRALQASLIAQRQEISDLGTYHRASVRLAEQIRTDFPRAFAESPSRSFWWGAASGAAITALAACLILFVALPAPQDQMADDIVAAHLRSLVGTHLIDVESSNHHVVKPWFAGKSDISPPVVDFAKEGFQLAGGRIDYVHGQRAAVVVYRHGAHIANLFVWKADGPAPSGMTTVNGYRLLGWNANGLSFSLVSDMAPEEMRRLAALIKKNTPGPQE